MKAGARLFLVALCGLTAMIGWSPTATIAAEDPLQANMSAETLTNASAEAPQSGPQATPAGSHGPEIPALRGAYSRTYEGKNGTAQLVLYSEPVNYRDATGRWQPIDDRLVASGSGYVNRADQYGVEFPEFLVDDEAGAISMTHGSDGVHFQLQGARATAAVVSGAGASYKEVLPSTDVDLTAASTGLQDVLVLKDGGAPSRFTYGLRTVGGLRPILGSSGDVDLVDPSGAVHLRIPAPVAGDSSGARGPASFGLTGGGDHWVLTVNLDRAWLSDSARAYPVTVDPTTTGISKSQLCTLVAASPNTSFCGGPVETETVSGQDRKRSLFEFSPSELAAIPSDSEIINAKFAAATETRNKGEGATVYNVKTAWDTTATWNRPSASGPEWPAGGPYDTNGSSAPATVAGSELKADVTSLVRDWVGNKYGGFYGLGLSQVLGGHPLLLGSVQSLIVTYAPITGERRQFLYDRQQLDDKMSLSVNVATGDLHLVNEDYALPGPGISINENRLYDSRRMGVPSDLSLGWKFSLARESRVSLSGPEGVWDAPDGSVTGLAGPGRGANGQTGKALGDGVDAVRVEGDPHFHGVMLDSSGIKFEEEHALKYFDRDEHTVNLQEAAGSCPAHGPTLTITDWTGATALTFTTNCVTGSGQVTQMTDATGRVWKYGYDSQNRLHTYTDPEGGLTTYEYNSNNLLEKITTPNGNVTIIGYDPGLLGRVASITRKDSKGNTLATTGYSYSVTGQSGPCQPFEFSTTKTDPAGRVWKYCFDSRHRMTDFIDPNGHGRDSTTYGAFSQVKTVLPATGESGSPYVSTLDPNTGVTTATSAPSGEQTSTTFGGSDPYEPTLTTDAQGNKMEMKYDETTGHLLTSKALNGVNVEPEQQSLTWEKGLVQKSVLGVAPNQQTTSYKYDSRGNQTETSPPPPAKPAKMTYDGLDRLSTYTDGDGNETTYHYDKLGRVKEVNYSDGSSIVYTYDGDGNLKQETSPTGTALYTYDGMDRKLTSTYGAQTVTQNYYADSQLKELTDAGGTVIYTYNSDGQLATISDPATRKLTVPATGLPAVVQLHWDTDQPSGFPHGVPTEVNDPIGSSGKETGSLRTLYVYDGNDRVKTITSTANGQTLQNWSYSYVNAANGNQQTAVRQFIEGPAGQQTTYIYDYMNRLVQAITTNSAKTQLYKYTYCYNTCTGHPASEEGFSNILQKTAQTGVETPTTTNYQYNADDEQTGTGYAYDNAGNMTTSPSYAMKFNVRDQLTQLTLTGAEPLALGQQGSTNSLLSTVGSTRLENGPLGVSATSNLEGGNGTYYTRTPEGQLIDSRTAEGTSAHYFLEDDRGSVVRTTNQAGTPDQEPVTYEPFGTPQGAPPAKPPTFGFDGGYQNFTSGGKTSDLIHFGERYYEPSSGSWTQPDPMTSASSPFQANPFQYAEDDPVNDSDPTGKMGMAGMETKAAQEIVKWCVHHPYEYYHDQGTYEHCQDAAQKANPGSDECHVWGALIALVGLPEGDAIPVIVARAAKAMGLGMLIAC